MDWRNLNRTDRIRVQQLDPANPAAVLGELDGVDLSGASLDAAYYSDTRTSGKLTVQGEGWQRGAFLRIIHEVPEWDYSRTLGTYVVTDDSATRSKGGWAYDLTLQSTLYALDQDRLLRPWTVAKNAMYITAAQQIAAQSAFTLDVTGARDARAKSAGVFDTGTSRLSALFTLCQNTNNRLDVDGQGVITLRPYVSPANRPASFRLDLEDARGIVMDGISRSTDWLELPDTVAVAHRYSETVNNKTVEREIRASATVGAGASQTKKKRGYTVVDFRDLSDMSPKTAARAQQLAAQYLANDGVEQVEWDVETAYLPVWEGDVIELVIPDGDSAYTGARKCLVKSLTLDLATMRMQLTLKETASGDNE